MKTCIVIVLEYSSRRYHDPLPLTYISRSTDSDFIKFYVESRKFYVESRNKKTFLCSSDSWEYKTLHINLPITYPSNMHHDLVPMTYISRSTGFVKFYVESRKFYVESRNSMHFSTAVLAGSIKPCIEIVLETLFKHAQ